MKQGLFLGLVVFCSWAVFPQAGNEKSAQGLMQRIKQVSGLEVKLGEGGWNRDENELSGTPGKGGIVFSRQKWLMYLIHWGPVQRREITIEYVKDRMNKMWGVTFEFSGREGKTSMAGHDAVFVEAYGTGRAFYTRFIVWNCPQSGREIIADTNYNLMLKTPKEDFENEWRSARTLCCHPGAEVERSVCMAGSFASEKYDLSFRYPEEWFVMDSPFKVPFAQYEGIRDGKTGSLLSLCADQGIRVVLKWDARSAGGQAGPEMLGANQAVAGELSAEIKAQKEVQEIQNHGAEGYQLNEQKVTRIWGDCRFKNPENERERDFYSGRGIYQAAQWELPVKKKRITLMLLCPEFRYGTSVSSPGQDILRKLMRDLILNIK